METEEEHTTSKLISSAPSSNDKAQTTPIPQRPKPRETYPIDYSYFNTIRSHSIGRKFKDHVLLVHKNHRVWQSKSQTLKRMAKEAGEEDFWTYWGGYLREKDLTPQFAHRFCRTALSYSEWTTLLTIGMSKKYMNFLWTTCGRDDRVKPSGWWYA